jgi:hypothetical protein
MLDQFSLATGLRINYTKCVIVLMHMDNLVATHCVNTFVPWREGFPQSYLGLPLSNCKLRLHMFTPTITKANKFLAGWQSCFLNPMGHLFLLNLVLNGQQNYIMSVMRLPAATVGKIDKKMSRFHMEWKGDGLRCSVFSLLGYDALPAPCGWDGGEKTSKPRTIVCSPRCSTAYTPRSPPPGRHRFANKPAWQTSSAPCKVITRIASRRFPAPLSCYHKP